MAWGLEDSSNFHTAVPELHPRYEDAGSWPVRVDDHKDCPTEVCFHLDSGARIDEPTHWCHHYSWVVREQLGFEERHHGIVAERQGPAVDVVLAAAGTVAAVVGMDLEHS